jgi:hypothetical protein
MNIATLSSTGALQPAPADLPAETPPPWPPPAVQVPWPTPPFPDQALNRLLLTIVLLALAAMGPANFTIPLVIVSALMLIAAVHALVTALKQRPAVLAAHARQLRRLRATWARVLDAKVDGERRDKRGVLVSYIIEVRLALWPETAAPGDERCSAPAWRPARGSGCCTTRSSSG